MNFLQNLSPVWQATIASLFTCLMTTAGAFVIFFTDKPKKSFSVIAESSAAGIMLAASFFSLLSPAFEYPCAIPPYVAVTLGFCIGGGVIILPTACSPLLPRACPRRGIGKADFYMRR